MIEVKNGNLIIDKKSTPIKEINMIQSAKGKLYFSNKIVEIADGYYSIYGVYNLLKKAGFTNFVYLDNVVVNAENIDSLHINYYQYAGLSIFQSNKENAEMYMLVMNCKNGKSETISFSSAKEVEKYYHILDKAVADIKNQEVLDKLLNK